MALKLNIYHFCVTDFSLIYPKGTKEEDKPNTIPNYIKLCGFCVDPEKNITTVYVMDSFKEFGLSVADLRSKLFSGCVITGNGVISIDSNYNHRLDLDSYTFNYSWKYSIETLKGK